MNQIILVSGDEDDPRVVWLAAAYRAAGFTVEIRECLPTITGTSPHSIMFDELIDSLPNVIECTKPSKNNSHGPQRKTRGGKIKRW